MPPRQQSPQDGLSDIPRGASQKNAHHTVPLLSKDILAQMAQNTRPVPVAFGLHAGQLTREVEGREYRKQQQEPFARKGDWPERPMF